MSARAAQIRAALAAAIEAAQDASAYAVNDFRIEETHLPITNLPDLDEPVVYLTSLGGPEDSLTREGTWQGERPIQVVLKQIVDPKDTDAVDALELLLDQLKQTARDLIGSGSLPYAGTTYGFAYSHLRNELQIKDPQGNGTGYAFGLIRTDNVFEGPFNAVYEVASHG